jgi:hypothetical protein
MQGTLKSSLSIPGTWMRDKIPEWAMLNLFHIGPVMQHPLILLQSSMIRQQCHRLIHEAFSLPRLCRRWLTTTCNR